MNKKDKTPEEIYQEFWKPIIETEGEIDIEQLKKELFDCYTMIMEVPKVYCHITGDHLSKPTYLARVVIEVADEYQERLFEEWMEEGK